MKFVPWLASWHFPRKGQKRVCRRHRRRCWAGAALRLEQLEHRALPSFLAPRPFGDDQRPSSVAVGEFNGDGLRDPAAANLISNHGSVLWGTGDGPLRAADKGRFREFPVPTPESMVGGGMAAGPDGNLWFTENRGNKIGRITLQGEITEFPIPTPNSAPVGLSFDAAGNLWFCEGTAGKIGRLTLAGEFTEFPLPTGRGPVSPRQGPDGNIWFTMGVNNLIGRLDPDTGDLTEFAVPTANSLPGSIRNGPDGAMWFVERNGNRIGRITMEGEITEYTIPTPNSQPRQFEFDREGNLWFTEFGANQVGRMTLDGVFTEFPLPHPNSGPFGMSEGPGHKMWFSEATGNRIGRIDKHGRIKEFTIPTADSNPRSLRKGADGNIWFTEQDANQIGRLNLADQDDDGATAALLRAGDAAARATFYRHDLAVTEDPTMDRNPHHFWVDVPAERPTVLGCQSQIAAFFASDGQEILHPEPERFFEVPIQGPLPEEWSYIP